ncbi:coat F domain protein [Peptococcaceae bacterium CEB3]|nr:coat F domain protein [Peptococcaceae bacterium CEB3]
MPQQQMEQDKELVGTLIYQLKMECSSLLQAIIESANNDVRSQLTPILIKALQNHKTVFDFMSQKGWYKVEAAPLEQLNRSKTSFQAMQQVQSQQQ